MAKSRPTGSLAVDGKPASLLFFSGSSEVHGAFDFLFTEAFKLAGDDCDVPLLLAPVPFMNAALHQLKPKVQRLNCVGPCIDQRQWSRALAWR